MTLRRTVRNEAYKRMKRLQKKGFSEEQIRAAREFGMNVGLAFQIIDDILDVTSTSELLGKPVGSDEANQKSTLVSLLGLEECNRMVDKYTAEAIAALRQFDGDTKTLSRFAVNLARRKK